MDKKNEMNVINNIIKYLSINIKNIMLTQNSIIIQDTYEIRIRVNTPIYIKTMQGNYFISYNKYSHTYNDSYYKVNRNDIKHTMAALTSYSIHAYENEIKRGYITIQGGHRVGISGDCIYHEKDFTGFKNITSFNIRVAKDYNNCTNNYYKYIIKNSRQIYNTLIAGPPLSGKTTFIRELTRKLSDGIANPEFYGCDITVIDERGEIASQYNGIPQIYIGRRTDILSYCLKKDGFFMSIRSLAPKIIVSDELGSAEDFEIIQYALKSGVNIITTAHCFDISDLYDNIYIKKILDNKFIERIIILGYTKRPIYVKKIYDNLKDNMLYDNSN